MQVAAWGLAIGTIFFSFFGIKTNKDFFLMMGLIACVLGNIAFAAFLWEQETDTGRSNDTMATAYIGLAILSLYGIYCQFEMYREEGCGLDDDEEEEEEEPLPGGGNTNNNLNNANTPQIENAPRQRHAPIGERVRPNDNRKR